MLDSFILLLSGLYCGLTYARCLVSTKAKRMKTLPSSRILESNWENRLLSNDDNVKVVMTIMRCPWEP